MASPGYDERRRRGEAGPERRAIREKAAKALEWAKQHAQRRAAGLPEYAFEVAGGARCCDQMLFGTGTTGTTGAAGTTYSSSSPSSPARMGEWREEGAVTFTGGGSSQSQMVPLQSGGRDAIYERAYRYSAAPAAAAAAAAAADADARR